MSTSTATDLQVRPAEQLLTLTVTAAAHGQRLDRWLAEQLPDRSRSEIQRWMKAGAVLIDHAPAKASHRVETGQKVAIHVPAPAAPTLAPEAISLQIVYEDNDLLVIDKPAGLVVHPAPGHDDGTLVNAILHYAPEIEGVGSEHRPGIVHRLDKETSGLLVVAKHERAHCLLQAQFKGRTIYKEYLALVEGHIEPARGRIVAPIGRHPVDRKRQAILPIDPQSGLAQGREAITDYYVQGYYRWTRSSSKTAIPLSLVQVVLHTGRTHQIRVHMAWRKHPVVGDTLYGYRKPRLPLTRHFLHAHRLRLRLPSTNEEREFVAPLPPELEAIVAQLELQHL
ncbi:MAG: RluA family pseudouridine synthase [Caldilineaceae bacterium]